MAIITDATGRQLAQAVGGIDTTGLVKDSTLQATNTELSNIDTTGQGIASAITALGSTLGSDKANIDGSNIANPSAFRQNIGLQIDTFRFNGTPNNWFDIVTDCPLNGYVPLGFIGTSLSRSHWDYTFVYDGNTSSTYWAVRVASPVSTVSGTYSGSFIALKIN